jgi:ATP-binding cassette subfamily C protein
VTLFLADVFFVLGVQYAGYVCLLTITGLLEAVSLAALVPLLAAVGVGSSGTGAGGVISRVVSDVLHGAGVPPTPTAICAMFAVALIASTAMFLAQAYVGANLQTAYVYRWQQRLATSIFGARWRFLQQRRQGDLVNALITEPARLGAAFYQAGLLMTGIIHSIAFLAVAALLSLPATAVVITGGVVLFAVTRPFVRRSYEYGAAIAEANAALQSFAGELTSGGKLVKATATETETTALLTAEADRLRANALANAFDVQVIKGIFDFGAAATAAAILLSGQSVFGTPPAVTLVVLAIFVRLMPKITAIQHGLQSLAFAAPAIEAMRRIADDAAAEREVVASSSLPQSMLQGPFAVELRNLHVHYGDVEALAGIDLDIAAGSCVAIAGGSGSGKSSAVDAVLGLVGIAGGTVRVNGTLLSELPLAPFRRRVGYMGQETVLFNATVRENIVWGRTDCDDEDLAVALRTAGAAAFVARLSKGDRTNVGDRGVLLSGGERQRLALARALVGSPGLLILDEATSSLDAETEKAVMEAIATLRGRTTVIIVAHRLSSLRVADTIAVLDEGRVVEQGTWSELIQQRGRFYDLWTLQPVPAQAAPA